MQVVCTIPSSGSADHVPIHWDLFLPWWHPELSVFASLRQDRSRRQHHCDIRPDYHRLALTEEAYNKDQLSCEQQSL